ncbi:MAG: hypothetical protein KME31_09450 [Tolypothrix carrinoi HA7290-LM1]|nr:hypothetical protein [Tolypothrix carrinoi HA7290-LM1]
MTRLCFKSAEPTAGASTEGTSATHCLPNALAPPCPMPHYPFPIPHSPFPSHFSRMHSPHFSDVTCESKTARYEHQERLKEKFYVFITGSV